MHDRRLLMDDCADALEQLPLPFLRPAFPFVWHSTIARYSGSSVSAASEHIKVVSQPTNARPRLALHDGGVFLAS